MPLEEVAAIFGDLDEVMVFSEDIHVDHITHELVIDSHGGAADGKVTRRVATEAYMPERAHEKVVEKV